MQFYFNKRNVRQYKSNSHMDGDDDNDNKQLLDEVEHIMNYQNRGLFG